mgnify:CR=1 FL=1
MKFSEMTYTRPDINALLARCKQLAAKAADAQDGDALIQVYYEQSRAFADYTTASQLANIHYTCDTRDAYWKAEQDFFDANGPAVTNASVEISRAFLANPYVDALTEHFGTTCVAGMKNAVLGMDDRTVELQQEFNALVSQYQQIYGGALVELDGKQLTIPQLGPYKEDLDPAVRRAAYEAEAGYFDAHRDELDTLYTKIVKNLNQQAKVLGYKDYSELSYVRMNRIGYGQAEIQAFRDQVARDVVPELQKVMAMRAKRTGITHPTFTDLPIIFKDGNPKPIPGYQARMDAARTMYHELSPETAEFIDAMFDMELFDVLSKEGKAPGGYCTYLADYKAPFIFSNFNGTDADVNVLTHEAGHAFAGFTAAKFQKIPELCHSTSEIAEIHSMSMELWTYPWMEKFFGDRAEQYRKDHLADALMKIPYMVCVDEFQHKVFENPEMTAMERRAVWSGLEKIYMPWRNYAGNEFLESGAFWIKQQHIFLYPFYYVDYAMAQMGAFEFYTKMKEDRKAAWADYYKLCAAGGSMGYFDLLKYSGLHKVLEDGSVKLILKGVFEELGL